MQPLFARNTLQLSVWVASVLIWRVMEEGVGIWSRKRLRAGAQRQDKGSYIILLCLIGIGSALGVYLAFQVPATAITSASVLIFWFGIALIYAGIGLRLYAIITLGSFFTTTVAIAAEQTVVAAGPYRLIRHPSYTGALITLLGIGLSLTNYLSLLVIMACALIGFSYRIHVEEQVLQAHLGQRYLDYMRHTKRLIPFVL